MCHTFGTTKFGSLAVYLASRWEQASQAHIENLLRMAESKGREAGRASRQPWGRGEEEEGSQVGAWRDLPCELLLQLLHRQSPRT